MSDHHHHEHHVHDCNSNERITFWAGILVVLFAMVEFTTGWFSNSLGLMSDAAHMATDSFSLFLAYIGFRLGKRSPNKKFTYGYQRAEVLASLLNGLLLVLISVLIFIEAFKRMYDAPIVIPETMIIVGLLALCVEFFVLKLLHSSHDHDHVNMAGAIAHIVADLVGSVAAILAGIIIYFTDWYLADPILSFVVGVAVFISSINVIKRSVLILMETTPDGFDEDDFRVKVIEWFPKISDVHHVHIWEITSGKPMISFHINISDTSDIDLCLLKEKLKEHMNVDHSVIQVEYGNHCCDEEVVKNKGK